eukprot:3053446-Rhodomonas_salina.1
MAGTNWGLRNLLLVVCGVVFQVSLSTAFLGPFAGLHRAAKAPTTLGLRPGTRTANWCMQATATTRWTSDVIAKRKEGVSSGGAEEDADSKAGGKKKLQKFFKTIKKPKGTVAIVGEIKRKDPTDPEFAVNMPDAAECSKAFHDCKV